MMKDIYEEVGEPAALELVAEEAAELAQACLKLSRILKGENPTPVPEVLAAEKVMEEAADVQTALSVLSSAQWYDEDKVMYIQWKKSERWKERLRKREEGNGQDGGNTENDLVKKQGDLVKDLVDDTISRAAALNACRNPEDGENAYAYGDEIEKRLKALPPPPGCEDAVSRDALDILIEEAQTAWLRGDTLLMYPALKKGLKKVPPVTPKQPGCEDAVPRTSVEYICRKNTVSTNPYEHKYHDKFIQFMDDPEISDFGRWQHSNGFNTALVAVKCDLDKVPSVTPKQPGWIPGTEPQKGEGNG